VRAVRERSAVEPYDGNVGVAAWVGCNARTTSHEFEACMNVRFRFLLAFTLAAYLASISLVADDKGKAKEKAADSDAAVEALQDVQDIVGAWEGLGAKSDKSLNWEERLDVQWTFKNGKAALSLTFSDQKDKDKGRLLEEARLSYDPEKKLYRLKAYKAGEGDDEKALVVFEGKRSTSGLTLDRINKGKVKDELDRVDLKILNDGDRIVYSVSRRVGQSKVYKPLAQIGLNRQGTSIANREASGPKCIVTGGAGTMTVSYEGNTYYVCCSGCRAAFLENPQKYIAKLNKK
jgi:YHS domain-containing protein